MAGASRPQVAAGASRATLALVGLNVLLAGALLASVWPSHGPSGGSGGNAGVSVVPSALAQGGGGGVGGGGASRARGQYLLLAGRVNGSSTAGVYIIDSVNREIAAVRWDRSAKRLVPLGFRDIGVDSGQGQREK